MAHKKAKTLKDYGSSVEKNPCCGRAKVGRGPYRVKIKMLKAKGLLYVIEPAMAHGFNAEIDKTIGHLWLKI
jgi:hypothetical protein